MFHLLCVLPRHVEPSYVIRKFLDAQRINNLTLYLEALHERHYAGPDHTTLLLNCYTKLKEEDKLRRFIRGEKQEAAAPVPASGAAAGSTPPFNSTPSMAGAGAGGSAGAGAGAASDKSNGDVVNFQVDTAIEVLRDAGYLDEGLYLAKKHGEHDW